MSLPDIDTTGEIKLTEFSRGSGCGCKIAPAALKEILASNVALPDDDKLIVGNSSNDDAAVYDLGNGTLLISTTDFFMPVVDDARMFGKIAAANAISDVYAMGGKPLLALAILGWPVDKIPNTVAQRMLEGAKEVCAAANIPLAGGHSIDSIEPVFGLCVNGLVAREHLKRNNTARVGDVLLLTKPIGLGILSAAHKRGVLKEEHLQVMLAQMQKLNDIGEALGQIEGVHAMTDITGFGLLGHVTEMAEGSNLSAELYYSQIPVAAGAKEYLAQRIVPDATYRNWNSYSAGTSFDKGVNVMEAFSLLPDPQTNGGLLLSVAAGAADTVKSVFSRYGIDSLSLPVGRMVERQEKTVIVMA